MRWRVLAGLSPTPRLGVVPRGVQLEMTQNPSHFPVSVSAADVKGDGDVAGGAGAGDASGGGLRGWFIMH